MDKIIIEGLTNLEAGFSKMTEEIEGNAQQMLLNTAAEDVKQYMARTAPYNLGALSRSIDITAPNSSTRTIGPNAKNALPGNQYGLPVETGATYSKLPNPKSIALNLGVSDRMGWAIAIFLKNRGGRPANPFVGRTYEYAQGHLDSQINVFLMTVTGKFGEGAIR